MNELKKESSEVKNLVERAIEEVDGFNPFCSYSL